MFSVYLVDSINLRRFVRVVSLVVGFLWPGTSAFSAEADLFLTDLSQEYDGQEKSPLVTTEPPNLEVTLEYFPGQIPRFFSSGFLRSTNLPILVMGLMGKWT